MMPESTLFLTYVKAHARSIVNSNVTNLRFSFTLICVLRRWDTTATLARLGPAWKSCAVRVSTIEMQSPLGKKLV